MSLQARKAYIYIINYGRHDNGTCPEKVVEDVPPHYLEELKEGSYFSQLMDEQCKKWHQYLIAFDHQTSKINFPSHFRPIESTQSVLPTFE